MIRIAIMLGIAACGGTEASPDAAPDVGPPLGWGPDVRLTNSAGASQITYNFAHSIAVGSGDVVHAVWFDDRDGVPQIYYKRSLDSGASWEADRRLVADATPRQNPAIAASGDTVYASWHEVRGSAGFFVVVARSLDAGVTWEPPVTVSTSGQSAMTSIAADGAAAQLVWHESATGSTEIGRSASIDRGATWSAPTQMSGSPYHSWVPNIAMQGARVITSWVDYADGNEEEYQRLSTDGGTTWGPAARRTTNAGDSWAPSVAISGDVVHLFWFDRRDSAATDLDVEAPLDTAAALVGVTVEAIPARNPAIYYLDDFQPRLERKLQAIMGAAPAWVANGGNPMTLQTLIQRYQDRFAVWAMSWEIYYKRSTDGGVTFGADTRMTTAPFLSQRPSVVAVGDRVDVVWFDGRDGSGTSETDTEIYYRGSTDGGLTWSPDLRLTTAPGVSKHASIAATADRVHVLWYDGRDGNDEIYYKRLVR
jgi:BNR repeat-like domain